MTQPTDHRIPSARTFFVKDEEGRHWSVSHDNDWKGVAVISWIPSEGSGLPYQQHVIPAAILRAASPDAETERTAEVRTASALERIADALERSPRMPEVGGRHKPWLEASTFELFHHFWTNAVNKDGYVKAEWRRFEDLLSRNCRSFGPGR